MSEMTEFDVESSVSRIEFARRLCYLYSQPIPPVVVNIKGVNVLCSMSRTVLEYCNFF